MKENIEVFLEKKYQEFILERKKILSQAAKKCRIELLIRRPDAKEPFIFIIQRGGNPVLGRAVYVGHPEDEHPLLVEDMDAGEDPFEVLINEPPREAERLEQIAKYLPEFLERLCPDTKGITIDIYRSMNEHKLKKPELRLITSGKVLTTEELYNPQ